MRALRSTFWQLSLAMGVSTIGRSMLGTAVPLYAVTIGLAPVWVGVLVALPNALPVVLGMTAGRWVDRGGAGRWLAIGTAGMASAPLLLVLAPGLPALAMAQLLVGFFQLFAALASQSYVADLSPDRSLERDYASYATLLSAGRLVGPLAVGIVIDAAGFRPAFAVAAAAAAAAFAMSWGLRRGGAAPGEPDADRPEAARLDAERSDAAWLDAARPDAARSDAARSAAARSDADLPDPARPGADGSEGSPGVEGSRPGPTPSPMDPKDRPRYGAREAWRNVGVKIAVLASAGVFVAISVRQAFLPVVLDELGYPATGIGALISLGSLASVAVRPFMPWFARRLGGPARTLVVAMATAAIGVGLLGSVTAFWAFAALSVAAGAATGVGLPLSIVTVARRVAPLDRGTALGLRLSSNRAAQLVTPMLIGAVIGAAGFGLGFGLVGAILAVLAGATARLTGTFERDDRARERAV